jgi:hypothetical protein
MSFKKKWDKIWFILWKDDSPKGWIISIIFLFIVIKFIFFPTLSLITGTSLPLAIVESCSMYHEGNLLSNYDNWWESQESKYEPFDITKEQFKKFIFKKGFNKGDILFIVGTKPEKLKVGDVVIFAANEKNPIIHRIVKTTDMGGNYLFSTIGDHNSGQLSYEKNIKEDQLIGRAVFKLAPYLGWGKLIFYEHRQSEQNQGFC